MHDYGAYCSCLLVCICVCVCFKLLPMDMGNHEEIEVFRGQSLPCKIPLVDPCWKKGVCANKRPDTVC